MTKICNSCREEKNLCDFVKDKNKKNGIRSICIQCENTRVKKHYYENKSLKIKKQIDYVKNNREKVSEYQKKYREQNREKLSLYIKDYRNLNKEKLNEYEREKKKNDSIHKLKHTVRNRILVYFKSKGLKKNTKTFQMIGCSPEQLKVHLEKYFTEGMSWDKLGKQIHIDHIIPLSTASNEEEIYKLCHYSNLQPLWSVDNLKKSNKII